MKRIFGVLMVAGLVLTGCKEGNGNKDGGGGTTDMKVSSGDMATSSKAATGEPCTKNSDCQGNLCLTENMGVFQGGYCSRTCTSDTQCGDDICYQIGTAQNVCVKPCEANDCRTGYACWLDGVCLPPVKDYFIPEALCNPTTLTNPNCAAGEICRRYEHSEDGSGVDKGLCETPCVVGEDTCGESVTGAFFTCGMVDNSKIVNADRTALYEGDKGAAPRCTGWKSDVVTPNAVGAKCEFDFMGTAETFAFACVNTSQCALNSVDLVQGYGEPVVTGGDNNCRVLCYKDGAKPVINADAGQEGTPFTACPGGTTCKDAFGVFNNANGLPQVGLCQP